MCPVRIASLVPSSTEMLFALGLGEHVVGVTHECDFPQAAAELPVLTRSLIPTGLDAAEIDRAVRERTERGESLYALDDEELADLAPDLIVTQAVCAVCAVSYDDVRALAERMERPAQVLSLDPSTLGEVLDGLRLLGEAAGVPERADELIELAADRLDRVSAAVAGAPRPRVAALEWLDPPYVGGHWVPQMIELAGGEDALGFAGERSYATTWDTIAATRPEVAVVMPCGYGLEEARDEAEARHETLAGLGVERMVAVDASAFFSRPGPRLVDGVELLAHALHPDRVPAPPTGRVLQITPPALAGA